MFGALKPGFRSLATLKLVVMLSANFKPKRTAAASAHRAVSLRQHAFLVISSIPAELSYPSSITIGLAILHS